MKTDSRISPVLWTWNSRRAGYVFLALTAAAAAIAVVAVSAAVTTPAPRHASSARGAHRRYTSRAVDEPPVASEFAADVVRTTAAYAVAHGDEARITNVDCVQASPGHYMCSYAITRPTGRRDCHLMQAVWTPRSASTYTVTLAGRVNTCATLRQALHSLR